MKVLNQSAKAAHASVLAQKTTVRRYSQFPVNDTEFWTQLFNFAKDPATAQKVLNEIGIIEEEPCIESDRIAMNVQTARRYAMIALLN